MSGKCQSSRKSVTSQIRPTVAALQETVDLEALKDYLGTGLDGRTSQLQAYVDRHGSEGVRMGRFSTIFVDYYKAPNYGRLLFSSQMSFRTGSIQPECQNDASNIWRRYHEYVELGQVNMQEIVN